MSTSPLPSTFKFEKYRAKTHSLIIYPEWESIDDVLLKLSKENTLFTGISPLHDKDVYTDGEHAGEPKKPHYHVVLRYKNAVWSSAISDRTGVPHQYKIFEPTVSFRGSVRYLIHHDDPDKYQYSKSDIWTNNQVMLDSCFEDLSVDEDDNDLLFSMQYLYNALQEYNFPSLLEFHMFAIEHGFGDCYNKCRWDFIEYFRQNKNKSK